MLGPQPSATILSADAFYKQSPSFTSNFVYDGPNLIQTMNSSGVEVASYTQGVYIDEPLAEFSLRGSSYYRPTLSGRSLRSVVHREPQPIVLLRFLWECDCFVGDATNYSSTPGATSILRRVFTTIVQILRSDRRQVFERRSVESRSKSLCIRPE